VAAASACDSERLRVRRERVRDSKHALDARRDAADSA
jgi:hypothetical protein